MPCRSWSIYYHCCFEKNCTILCACGYYPAMVNVVQLYRINILLHAFTRNTVYCTRAGSIFTRPSDVLHGNTCNKIYISNLYQRLKLLLLDPAYSMSWNLLLLVMDLARRCRYISYRLQRMSYPKFLSFRILHFICGSTHAAPILLLCSTLPIHAHVCLYTT